MLRFTVELYMQLTNRNMAPYHTDATLTALHIKHAQWQVETQRILDGLLAMQMFKAHKFKCGITRQLPKIHDVHHLILSIPERGPTLYHSTEG